MKENILLALSIVIGHYLLNTGLDKLVISHELPVTSHLLLGTNH